MTSKKKRVNEGLRRIMSDAPRTVRSLIAQVRRMIRTVIGFDLGCVALVEGDGEPRLVIEESSYVLALPNHVPRWGRKTRFLKIGGPELPKDEQSFMGRVAFTKRPRRSGDVSKEVYFMQPRRGIRSELAVPVMFDGVILAVINLESTKARFYKKEDQDALEAIARRIARPLADLMSRQGLIAPLPKSMEEIDVLLNRIPPGISLEACGVLNDVARVVAETLHSRVCSIWLLDRSQPALVLRGAWGANVERVGRLREKKGHTLSWQAIEQRSPVRNPPLTGNSRAKKSGAAPQLVVPLLAGGRGIGAVKVERRRPTRENPAGYYTVADSAILQMLQSQVAASIELRRKEMERRELVMERSNQVSTLFQILKESDLDQALKGAVAQIARLVGGRYASIFLWDDSKNVYLLRASKGLPHNEIGKAFYDPGQGLTGWVAFHGRPLRLDNRSPEFLKTIDPPPTWESKHKEGPPRKDLTLRAFLAVPIFLDQRSIGVIRVSDRSRHGSFSTLDELMLTVIASNIANVIAQSRRYQDRVELLKQLQEPRKILTAAIEKMEYGIATLVDSPLKEAVEHAAKALGSEVVTLFKIDPRRGTFDGLPIAAGSVKHPELIKAPTRDEDPASTVLRRGSHYWESLPPAWRHRRSVADPTAPKYVRFATREGIRSAAGIRLEVGSQTVGVLFLSFRVRQRFDLEKQHIIESFASQIALCLQIARISQKMHIFGAREQAEYLARELHDAVLPVLAWRVVGGASAAKDLVRMRNHLGALEELSATEKAARYCLEECRGIMMLMRTPIIEELGLVGAIASLGDGLKNCTLQLDLPPSDDRIPLHLKNHLYRITQAALANTVAHAQARKVIVRLSIGADQVELSIKDDGLGFVPHDVLQKSGHFGLRGIEERVHALGGIVSIQSAPHQGTAIRVTVGIEGGTHASEIARAARA